MEIVTRPRLIENIHSLLNKKLILLSAPAGYGKTSLLLDMVDKSEIPFCWLSLDILDQEPQRFLSYFIACIQERFPLFGVESTDMLRNTVSVEKENERIVVTITNEIYEAIHEHFAIILDDYQFINTVPEIQLFINRFMQLAGEHCHLILSTRLLPSLPDLHLLVARDQVGGMSLEDLAFLPDEIQTYFSQNDGQFLSISEADEIARKTDGWITSIALTGTAFFDQQVRPKTPAAKTGIELYDYFTREILEKQPHEMREFLLFTSLFDDFSLNLCLSVLEPILSDQHLEWKTLFGTVQNNNIFAIPVGNDGLYFRYQHLFQEYLQTKLQEENPQIIQDVMHKLAEYYCDQQDWEKAHHIYKNIGDQDALIALIEKTGSSFILNGRVVTLGHWLENLPVSILQQNPHLLSLQGAVAYTQGEVQLGISLLSQAESEFRARQDDENLVITLIRRAAAYREMGDLTHALEDAEESIRLTQDNSKEQQQFVVAAALRIKGLTLFRQGQTLEALPVLEQSLQLFTNLKDEGRQPVLEMELGAVNHTLGNSETAIKHYNKALKAWEATGNLGWQATLMNNLAVMYHYRGEYEKAFLLLENAIDSAKKSGYVNAQALALSSLGDLLADLQEIERAEECFDQALVIASQLGHSFLIFYTSIAKARMARLTYRLTAADALLRDLFVHVQEKTSPAEEALFRLESGCLLVYSHKIPEAVEELTRAIKLYERDGRGLEVCICRLWLAAARITAGETESARQQFSELLTAYQSLKEPSQLYVAAGDVENWLEKSNLGKSLFADLQPLLYQADEFTKRIPVIRKHLRRTSKSAFLSPPHLSIHALGPTKVFVNGKQIGLPDWQTRETRDLFFFFLEAKPQTKEEIAAIFWPDLSPARLKMRFKTNLYRLRHAVGQNTILFEGERYRFNHAIDYEYDLETYQDLIRKTKTEKNPRELIQLLQSAIELVKGPLLADIDTEWGDMERSQFENQYFANLLSLAELYLETGQTELVIETCRVLLERNNLMEEAYRLIMSAHARMGNTTEVARIYKTCKNILFTELGVKPSRDTEKLYQSLI